MRLFRRRDNDAADSPGPEGPATGAPDGEGDVVRQPKQPTGDWMTMPPMAPSFPSMPTTFRVQTLPEILTSHHDTRLSGSLGHAVSPDGPSGSISGLASRPGDGLAHSGDISRSAGMGELLLREPHHAPAEPEPAVEVRRLADPAPISTSSPSMASPSLPEPTVSRSLLDTAPLAARAATERPLPVARIVDAPAASAASAAAPVSTAAPSSLSSEPEPPDVTPSHDDDRVGGFGVGSDEPSDDETMAVADDVPRTAAPADLMPPIQPRRIQRRIDTAAPLLGDAAPTTSVDPVVPDASAPKTPGGGALPLVNPAPSPDITISRLAQGWSPPSSGGPSAGSSSSSADSSSSSAASDSGSSAGSSSGSSGSGGSGGTSSGQGGSSGSSSSNDGSGGSSASTSSGSSVSTGGSSDGSSSGSISGVSSGSSGSSDSSGFSDNASGGFGDAGSDGAGSDSTVSADDDLSADDRGSGLDDLLVSRLAEGGAPLAGGRSMTAAGTPLGDTDTPATIGGGDLPLHAPASAATEPPIQRLADVGHAATSSSNVPTAGADNAATGGDDEASSSNDPATDEPDDAPTTGSAPTLGADAPMVHVQPMAESAGAQTTSSASPGTAHLPLAPSTDLGGALQPPAPRGPADVQRSPEASSETRPLTSQAAAGAATASASAPSLQRLASSGSASSPALTSGALPFVRPLPRTASPATASPMSMLTPPSSDGGATSDLPVQLRRLGTPDVGAGVATAASLSAPTTAGAAALPLAGVQRLANGAASTATTSVSGSAASAGNGAPATSDLPLHTPAASVPTAADVAIRAGLAERGPDGGLLYTSAAAASSFSVQRQADDASGWNDGGDRGNGTGDLSVQREAPDGMQGTPPPIAASNPYSNGRPAARPAAAAPEQQAPSGQDANADNKSLAAEAKKLYPFIRSALEADIRRQIEGKSRASRFRP